MINFGAIVKAVDAVLAVSEAARSFRSGSRSEDEDIDSTADLPQTMPAQTPSAQVDARLTNIVVAALKEAFDRDHARLELERAHLNEERRRAEAALRLEMYRQAADRELARLRLLAGGALVGWLASVVMMGAGMVGTSIAARAVLAAGWLLLLGALGAAFAGQRRVAVFVPDGDHPPDPGAAGAASLWLLVVGLAATAMSVLL